MMIQNLNFAFSPALGPALASAVVSSQPPLPVTNGFQASLCNSRLSDGWAQVGGPPPAENSSANLFQVFGVFFSVVGTGLGMPGVAELGEGLIRAEGPPLWDMVGQQWLG